MGPKSVQANWANQEKVLQCLNNNEDLSWTQAQMCLWMFESHLTGKSSAQLGAGLDVVLTLCSVQMYCLPAELLISVLVWVTFCMSVLLWFISGAVVDDVKRELCLHRVGWCSMLTVWPRCDSLFCPLSLQFDVHPLDVARFMCHYTVGAFYFRVVGVYTYRCDYFHTWSNRYLFFVFCMIGTMQLQWVVWLNSC